MYERSARYIRSNDYNNYLQTLVDAIVESDQTVGNGEDIIANTISLSLTSTDNQVICC
jgi:hypothetical protein